MRLAFVPVVLAAAAIAAAQEPPGAMPRILPPIGALVPFTPTVERAFPHAEHVRAYLRVYQGGDDMMRPVHTTIS